MRERSDTPASRRHKRVSRMWVAYSVALLAGSALPGASVPSVALLGWDKLAHAVAFALLAALTAAAFRTRWSWLWLVLYCASMGLATEGIQAFVPGREASLGDWAADLVGTTVVLLAALVLAGMARRATRAPRTPTDRTAVAPGQEE